MADRWCTTDGWAVEIIEMSATPDRHDGESFRVSHHGFHVGCARSVRELEQRPVLAELEEALRLAVQDHEACSLNAAFTACAHLLRGPRSPVARCRTGASKDDTRAGPQGGPSETPAGRRSRATACPAITAS
jgi:hypothetical protein